MAEKSNLDLERDPCAIVGSRMFNAPRDLVFAAFDPTKAARVMNAFMKMKKLDIATLQRAADGK